MENNNSNHGSPPPHSYNTSAIKNPILANKDLNTGITLGNVSTNSPSLDMVIMEKQKVLGNQSQRQKSQ